LPFTRNYEWSFQRNYHLFLCNEILRKQNKILLELKNLKEIKAMKESQEVILGYFQINENREWKKIQIGENRFCRKIVCRKHGGLERIGKQVEG